MKNARWSASIEPRTYTLERVNVVPLGQTIHTTPIRGRMLPIVFEGREFGSS